MNAILTPAAFATAARLARLYGHQWGRYAPAALRRGDFDAALAAVKKAKTDIAAAGGGDAWCAAWKTLEDAAIEAVACSGGDPAKIDEVVVAADSPESNGWWGITAPSPEHTTCSGRTHWTILPSGEVRGEIRVPALVGEYGHVHAWTTCLRVERGKIIWVRPDLVDIRQLAGAASLLGAATGQPALPGWQWFGPAVAGCPTADLVRLRKQADWVQRTQTYPVTPERSAFGRGDSLLGGADQMAFDAL